ncbi:MAG: ROK family transcriptional regulator [Firmicutes bacterium]|nr:ROK family transcriptional regulator [Bacillota bacterium]
MSSPSKRAIVKLLRTEGPLSRKQIAERLHLSFPTVSASIAEMLPSGVIKEVTPNISGKGRKPTLLEYNRDIGYVIGVDVGGKYTRVALSNIGGEMLSKVEIPTFAYQGVEKVFTRVETSIEHVIGESGIDPSRLLAIGVGVPGIVNANRGYTFRSPFIADNEDHSLKSVLEEKFEVPVILENDVNMAVIGEKWKGAARGYRNIVFANLGVGFSCGIIINGELYRGANGAAGETGFMVIREDFLRDTFKEKGSLESRIAGEGIVTAMVHRLEQNNIAPDMVLPPERDAETVFTLALNNNDIAQEIINETITYFAMSLINIISVLNPEIVVIGGALGFAISSFLEKIVAIIEAHVPYVPKVVPSKLGTIAGVFGALAVALRAGRDDMEI